MLTRRDAALGQLLELLTNDDGDLVLAQPETPPAATALLLDLVLINNTWYGCCQCHGCCVVVLVVPAVLDLATLARA